jgi:hypothetical protein
LSYGAATARRAGGIRTHNTRLRKHVLRIGSRSYFGGDEVLGRTDSIRESNESNPSTVTCGCKFLWMVDVLQTVSCRMLFAQPNEVLPRGAFALRSSVPAS